MNKKYEFTGETMQFEGHTLRRIRYNRDVGYSIKKGAFGGWLESEGNLSQEGDCIVIENAKVLGNACVIDDAFMCDDAVLKDNARLMGTSFIAGKSIVGADTIISDNCSVLGSSKVFFYQDLNHLGKPNISGGNTSLMNCEIEATGTIYLSRLRNQKIQGHINIEKEISKD